MILPYEPEPAYRLSARVSDAIAEECDGSWNPGQYRRHVFDFENGLRLIVSRDRIDDIAGLHVSASTIGGSKLETTLFGIAPSRRMEAFLRHAERMMKTVLGLTGMRLSGISTGKSIPHWLRPERKTT